MNAGNRESFKWLGRSVPRIDAAAKATGELKYLTDIRFPDQVWARVKRADYPHARILSINVDKARELEGVEAVLTHRDVPGQNAFGIVVPDQPVLCSGRVRYMGDPVALVAARSQEIAERALSLIEVKYEQLPVIEDPEEAILPGAFPIHDGGNIHQHNLVETGDVERAFRESDLIVEGEYRTPRQMHSFLETEGGVATADEEGNITIYAGSQHPFRDQLQIARALGIPPERIRVVSNPTGGGFGGKDEIVVQIHLALLAYHLRRPVKLWLSREESAIVGWKRHPEILRYKTGVKADGTLLANQVRIIADTGAYASLGGPVTSLSVGHCCGPYRVPNVKVENYCVYTNNGVCGAFRGFGVNQVAFAMETQMDIIAEKLGIDPIELRKRNAIRRGDTHPLGFTLTTSVGELETLESAERSELWSRRQERKTGAAPPWIKRGVGVASFLQGNGLGAGRPDYGSATIELRPNGCFRVAVSCPEIGQGNSTVYAQIASEALGCHIENVEVITGDTAFTTDSGPTSASRSTYTGGRAIREAAAEMLRRIERVCPDLANGTLSTGDLVRAADRMEKHGISRICVGTFLWPAAEQEIPGAPGLPEIIYSFATQIALVEVDILTGRVSLLEALTVSEAGRVINRLGYEGQADGGVVMGAGYALTEEALITGGRPVNIDFSTYILPTSMDSPSHSVRIVEVPEDTGPYGAKGIGEVVCVPIAPAITNAIYDAVGVRVRQIPVTPERLHALIQRK